MLSLLDHTCPSLAANLALDEWLLHWVDAHPMSPVLRFWESARLAVVLGVNGSVTEHVHESLCHAHDIPILRRASGGGTVLIGPGCLCYSLVLGLQHHASLGNVTHSYRWIMEHMACALGAAIGPPACIRWLGSSDLAMDNRKFSGNAQKRSRHALLHHGTILYRFPLEAITRYLKEPERRPDYRGSRRHDEFIGNLPIETAQLKHTLATAWQAHEPYCPPTLEQLQPLLAERYLHRDWINRRR